MNKIEIIESIICQLDHNITEIDKAFEERVDAAREAEGRNQSRYDTKGIEAAREAEGIQQIQKILQIQRQYFTMQKAESNNGVSSKIIPGSLVELINRDCISKWIYLVPCPGGLDVQEVSVVTMKAPIANQLKDKKVGSIVTFPDGEYTISQIL